jgi:hypothetical protein
MKIIMIIIGIIGILISVYCLYYQALVFVFSVGNQSSLQEISHRFFTLEFPQYLTMAIILYFLFGNIRRLVISFKGILCGKTL